jgi:hypothetical protein
MIVRNLKKVLPFLLTSFFVVSVWRLLTMTDNYAWQPVGNDLELIEEALEAIFFYKSAFWLIVANLAVFMVMQLTQRKTKFAGLTAIILLIFFFTLGKIADKKCVPHYYSLFLHQSATEAYLSDPLICAGYEIGPLLTQKITNKEMKGRRYAISALQKLDYQPATDVLGEILLDSTELTVLRADAYETLKKFDNDKAKAILSNFKAQESTPGALEVIELGGERE